MSIFSGVEPPAWLERIAQPIDTTLTGKVIGDLVGGLADATGIAIDKATQKQKQGINTSWIKELPGSIKPGLAEARLNVQNPLWKMQAQQAQLNMAQQGLFLQNQQSLIEARKTKLQMQQHDQEVLPKWLQDHPTWESRQDAEPPQLFTSEAQRMYRDVQLGDAQNIKHKSIVEGIDAYSKSVSELQKIDPIAAAPFATKIGKVPTPEDQAALGAALDKAQAKRAEAIKPKVETVDLGGGKTMTVIYNPKTGRYEQPKPSKEEEIKLRAQEKAAANELDYARQRVLILEREMAKLTDQKGDKAKKETLKEEWLTARKYYNDLLKRSKTTTAAVPATPAVPVPATKPEVNYDDFSNWLQGK